MIEASNDQHLHPASVHTVLDQISTCTKSTPARHVSSEGVIHNHAIAGNPVDWKIQAYALIASTYISVLGFDIVGIVVSIGLSVIHFALSDRVIGFSAIIYNDNVDHDV